MSLEIARLFLPRPPLAMALAAALALAPSPVRAQYFGQNKVHYATFDFKVLETPHFSIYYYPAEAAAAREVGRMAERWRDRLSLVLRHQLMDRQPIVLYASHPEFEETNVVEGLIGEGTGGVTESQRRRVVLPLAATLAETDHVLGHELVHAFQYDILGRHAGGVPLWFIEGMAEYLSIGPRSPLTALWMRDAVIEGTLPDLEQMDSPRYFPYRFGHAFWAYLGARYGDAMIGEILKSLVTPGGGAENPIDVIEAATGTKREELSARWHEALRSLYGVEARGMDLGPPAAGEAPIIAERAGSGALNVGPALSPDGSRIAFLSERNRLAIDLYVADTATGEVIRTLTSTAVDPHFQSLQFLQSAGAWSPDGRQLAVATVQDGKGRLSVFDVEREGVAREIDMEERGEMFQPSWSPDGRSIAYAAQIGGLTDLYIYDLDTATTRRLTNDAFADLQPAWSTDGASLLFTTDRGASNLATLEFARYRLARIDVATGVISLIQTGLSGNVVNPQTSADGQMLYFISDATGRPELYRARADGSSPTLLSAVATGVSGITPLSPALSVASHGRRAAYSVFRDGGYEIHFLDPGSVTAVEAPGADGPDLARLAPPPASAGMVATELRRPVSEQSAEPFETRPYSPSLSLLAAGQQVGVSTGGMFGTYVSGGISLLFSDVLGDHLLGTTFDVNGNVKDIGFDLSYVNRTSRWNWGLFTERVPLLSGTVGATTAVSDGQPVYVEITDLYRQTYSSVGAILAYPFSRASRFEMSAAANRIGFDHEVSTQGFDVTTGALIFDRTETLDSEPALMLYEGSAALVRDTASFGPTGPILGDRFRLEAAPTFGDLRFTNLTADIRRYVMPVRPLVFAGRALHTGRYGGGSDDSRLFPLFLGYPSMVRGYDPDSISSDDCTASAGDSCQAFDRLLGTRLFVINAEARMPLFGFGGDLNYGPVPTEVFAFFDAGIAWSASVSAGNRDWVRSAGAGARVNAFGFAVLEFNLTRPLDRRNQGWMFNFNLRPAF